MAMVTEAPSQLHPDRDKIFKFAGQMLPEPDYGQANVPDQDRFGKHPTGN